MSSEVKPRARSKKTSSAMAVHVAGGEHHVVGIGNLRVLIAPDGKYWTAQGLEIDYIAQGESIDDAKKQFEDGLAATIQQHLRVYGDIERLLAPAPPEIWKDAFDPKTIPNRFSQVTVHEIIREALPFFEGIDYLQHVAA